MNKINQSTPKAVPCSERPHADENHRPMHYPHLSKKAIRRLEKAKRAKQREITQARDEKLRNNLQPQIGMEDLRRVRTRARRFSLALRLFAYPTTNRDLEDTLVARIEDISAFIAILANCTDKMTLVAAVTLYARTYTTKAFLPRIIRIFERQVSTLLSSMAREVILLPQSGPETPQSNLGRVLEHARKMLTNWSVAKSSPLTKHVCTLVNFAIALGAIPALQDETHLTFNGLEIMKLHAWDFQKNAFSIAETILETVLWFFERGYQAFKTGDVSCFIYTESEALALDHEYSVLISAQDVLTAGKLSYLNDKYVEGIESEAQFETRIIALIEKFRKYRAKESNPPLRTILDNKINRLCALRADLVSSQHNAAMKIKPYCVMILGSSAVGKSTLAEAVINYIGQVNGIDVGPGSIATINDADKYDSEVTSNTRVIVMDDFGSTQSSKVSEVPTRRIFDTVNNAPKFALKADLNEKGNVQIKPDLVVITTNIADLNSHAYCSEPAALMRRVSVCLTVSLRDTHKNSQGGLDYEAFSCRSRDAWNIDINEVILVPRNQPDGRDSWRFNCLAKGVSLVNALGWMKEHSAVHYLQQKQIVATAMKVRNAPLCEHGMVTNVCDHCLDAQRIEVPPVSCPKAREFEDISHLKPDYIYDPANDEYVSPLEHQNGREFGSKTGSLLPVPRTFWDVLWIFLGMFGLVRRHVELSLNDELHEWAANKLRPYAPRLAATLLVDEYKKVWRAAVYTILGTATASVLYGLISATRSTRVILDPQGQTTSSPEPSSDDETVEKPYKNVWKEVEISPIPRNEHTVGATFDQLESACTRYLALVYVECGPGLPREYSHLFPLYGSYWLAPAHVFPEDKTYSIEVVRAKHTTLAFRNKTTVDATTISRIPGTDYVVLNLPDVGPQPNLAKFITDVTWGRKGAHCGTIYRDALTFESTKTTVALGGSVKNYNVLDFTYPGVEYTLTTGDTFKGMCMAPFITYSKTPTIIGFHLAGCKSLGVIGSVTLSQIKLAISKMSTICLELHSAGEMKTEQFGKDYTPADYVHPKNVVHFQRDLEGQHPCARI